MAPAGAGGEAAPAAIALDGVGRRFGRTLALEQVTLRVAAGECLALLGPNGAGKTTLVECCEGYQRPDAGRIRVLGLDPIADAGRLRWRVGIMLQQGGLYPQIRVAELVHLFARFYRTPAAPDRLLDAIGLAPRRGARVKQLSGGERQRLSLALALVGRPALLFLDEPTSGMDPAARRTTFELVQALHRRGTTILLSTHDLGEAERLADRIAILHHGRLLAVDEPQALSHLGAADRLQVETAAAVDLRRLPRLPGAGAASADGPTRFSLETTDPAATLAALTAWLRDEKVACRSVRAGSATLEEVFLQLTGEATAPAERRAPARTSA